MRHDGGQYSERRAPRPGARGDGMTGMARGGWWGTAALALALGGGCGASAPQFDLLVRGGQVLDGRGTPARRADVGVSGDRIVALGDLSGGDGGRRSSTRRAEVVSPGLHRRAGAVGHDAAHRRPRREPPAPGHHQRDHRRGRLAGVLDGEDRQRRGAGPRRQVGGLERLRPVLPAADGRRHRREPRHAGAGDAGAQRGHRPRQPRARRPRSCSA